MTQARAAVRLRFSTRVLLLQLAVVCTVVLMTAGTFAALTYQWLGDQAEERALAVARTVASSEDVRRETAVLAATPSALLTPETLAGGPLEDYATSAQDRTDALFVVVTDDAGLRLAHPNPALLGQKVSTDPSVALAGGEETSQENGTLGRSARAKVPVFAPGSTTDVVGEVSVGFDSDDIVAGMLRNIVPVALVTAASLALAAVASTMMGARLRRLTLGLEPEEISGLAQDQEAVLRGVDEGVIGISERGTITVFNEGARRLLTPGSEREYSGLTLAESGLPDFLGTATGNYGPQEHVVDERVVIVTARPVRLKDRSTTPDLRLGRVIMVRDRTEVQALTRQLDAVNALGTALRAQRHEFANRLHTISGLLALDRTAEARDYLGEILDSGPLNYPAEDLGLLNDPYLEAFIGAKSIEAHERGVELRIGPGTSIRGHITDPQDVTAVLGNLLDNAITAAVAGASPNKWVEVEVLDEYTESGGTLHVVVADSGDGLRGEDARIFAPGFSTASPSTLDPMSGHGVGLALVRHLARRRGGDVWVAESGSPQSHGAVFCARLPGVIALESRFKEQP
ncbi:two-component system, CitB family, sensor kinase [Arthrobacter alpinus]|uniref:histidine kinase n=1 Tax=Arthrobacter alpinus TaxID=656366 RepID=A0A1H5KQ60_9MICC|nr:sensor histidine kinase [Arthrobacter alpinus]SEE66557.1 two-component system, CitB family, sensor kinase [Arthrobacter alpinus]